MALAKQTRSEPTVSNEPPFTGPTTVGPGAILAEIDAMRHVYEQQEHQDVPSARVQFDFACLLTCSPRTRDVREGVRLLEQLLAIDVGTATDDVLHHLTLGYLKLGWYVKAKERSETWLCLKPRDSKARMLNSLVMEYATHDGILGIITLVLAGASFAYVLMKNRKS